MSVTIKGEPKPEAQDGFLCNPKKATGTHQWMYLGNQLYLCQKCGEFIRKADLKSKTEVD